jgi:GMP synthase (glutamine-hydrolysing)
MTHDLILVLDFGGQYNQLIVRRVRDLHVYSEILSYDVSIEEIVRRNPKGIILTGGPSVVTGENAPLPPRELFNLGIPILGICYGCQLMGHLLGGSVSAAELREYGNTSITFDTSHPLFAGLGGESTCWMSHTYFVSLPPAGFKTIASTPACTSAAIADDGKKLYGVQFHPEVAHTPFGNEILRNFINICGAETNWFVVDFAGETIKSLRERIGGKKPLCALSGGVDSSVAAVMVHRAVGRQLTCVFVDNGLLRLNEADEVERLFTGQYDMNFIRVNAGERFLNRLAGVRIPRANARLSARNLYGCSKLRPGRSAVWISWFRALFTRI